MLLHIRAALERLCLFEREVEFLLKEVGVLITTGGDVARVDVDSFHDRFERGVLMAASLANHFIMERAEVELITTGEHNDVTSGSSNEHLYKILGALATLEPTDPEDQSQKSDGKTQKGEKRSFLPWTRRRSELEKMQEIDSELNSLRAPIAWRLLDEVPVLRDDRRFKVLITSARKGSIPAHVWRSAHVVFMEDV